MTPSQRRIHHHLPNTGALGWLALLLALSLVLVACGGDDEAEAETADPTAAAVEATEAAEATDEPAADEVTGTDEDTAGEGENADSEVPDAIADLASDSGSATVTIGDETFEFSLAGTQTIDGTTYVGRCQSLFGMVLGSGFATDGRDITVDLEIPPVDWESYEDDRFDAPAIEVEDNVNNASWVADQADEFVSGSSIGEYEQEGTTASGSATFVNQWAPDSEPVEGTFELDCEA
ncbi:MAG: hypothetical protein AB1Z67_10175 [Candidatus Limnocylindrales bacterium]